MAPDCKRGDHMRLCLNVRMGLRLRSLFGNQQPKAVSPHLLRRCGLIAVFDALIPPTQPHADACTQ